jgi:lysophospholipase L1-like esterase
MVLLGVMMRHASKVRACFAFVPAVLALGCSGSEEEPAAAAENFCGKVGGGPGQAPEMTSSVDADDPAILYGGRMDFTDPKGPLYSAPAAYAKVRFTGTAVSVKLEDEFRWGKRNYYDVIVDEGSECERRAKIVPQTGTTEYPAIWGLSNGEHSVSFVKRTESSIGNVTFRGFGFKGAVGEPLDPPTRRVQIIGDSISCGVGADLPAKEDYPEGATFESLCREDDWGVPYHNANKAFGALVARSFGAEYQVTAVSGIGLVQNYSSNPIDDLRPLPEVYDSVLLQDPASPTWDPKAFVPDLVMIALGTNDFSPGDDIEKHPRVPVDDYVATYIDFIEKLRSDAYYPDAKFLLLGSPMLSDGYPEPSDTFRTNLHTAIASVEAHYTSEGIEAVKSLPIDKQINRGCSSHPSGTEHAEMAGTVEWRGDHEQIAPVVAELMGWQAGSP